MTKETKPFNLELAIAGHPLTTRDGREAKFIAYVPDNQPTNQVIVSVDGLTVNCYPDGKWYKNDVKHDNDLFLAPLGHCEGKPVFAGDKLICSDNGVLFTIRISNDYFNNYTWPKPERTFSMTESQFVELASIAYNRNYANMNFSYKDNAERVIAEYLDKQEKK